MCNVLLQIITKIEFTYLLLKCLQLFYRKKLLHKIFLFASPLHLQLIKIDPLKFKNLI